MTPLRKKMIEAMELRGFSTRTHQSYLRAVRELANYYRRSPERLNTEELQAVFVHLAVERGLSGASCRVSLHGIRFLYLQVLGWSAMDVSLTLPKKAQRIPELLTRAEITRLIDACANAKHRMMLLTCYGTGVRVSELVSVKVRHIDGERGLLRVEQGKGAKDRQVILSPVLLERLRAYWRIQRPQEWFFPALTQRRRLVFARYKRHLARPSAWLALRRSVASTVCATPTPLRHTPARGGSAGSQAAEATGTQQSPINASLPALGAESSGR